MRPNCHCLRSCRRADSRTRSRPAMLGRLTNALLATLGAAATGQAPAFQAQYRQQLAGRLDQARQDIAQLLKEAEAKGQTPEQFLQRAEQESGSYNPHPG